MKRLLSVLLTMAGVGFILLGLLFIVGSGGQARRLVVAAISLAVGSVATGLGVLGWRAVEAVTPERLRAELLELARRRSGEIAEADVRAALGRRAAAALPVLAVLVAEGSCQEHVRSGSRFWLFPELQPRLHVRYCEYCATEQPVSAEVEKCPRCGGPLTSRVSRASLGAGQAYTMDE